MTDALVHQEISFTEILLACNIEVLHILEPKNVTEQYENLFRYVLRELDRLQYSNDTALRMVRKIASIKSQVFLKTLNAMLQHMGIYSVKYFKVILVFFVNTKRSYFHSSPHVVN